MKTEEERTAAARLREILAHELRLDPARLQVDLVNMAPFGISLAVLIDGAEVTADQRRIIARATTKALESWGTVEVMPEAS